MASTVIQDVVETAGRLAFKRGFAGVTIPELTKKVGISETSFRRHFSKGKVAVYWAMLERAACIVLEAYLEELAKSGLNPATSDPKKMVLAYLETVLGIWNSDREEKWAVSLLFGYDDFSFEGMPVDKAVNESAAGDIELLDQILRRGCGGDDVRARSASCIVLGTLNEYVRAELDEEVGYKRNYSTDALIDMIDLLLSTVFEKPHPLDYAGEGISREKFKHLGEELMRCAKMVDDVVNGAVR